MTRIAALNVLWSHGIFRIKTTDNPEYIIEAPNAETSAVILSGGPRNLERRLYLLRGAIINETESLRFRLPSGDLGMVGGKRRIKTAPVISIEEITNI